MYRIAVVEDDRDFVDELKTYLEQYAREEGQEFEISVFYDGAEILEDYTPRYDLILLDIEMPKVNGMDAAEKIREVDENVVLMFITNMAQYAIRGYSVGALDFVMKPITYYTFSMKIKRALKRVQKKELVDFLYKTQQEQYKMSRENIAVINQKCHDLKHQIRALRNADKEELDKYLGEIEESVEIYEAIVKTGNDVFDTILTEKSLYCKKHGIQVTCVADGSQMGFIDTIDLYAILGNVMDNAIEAVEKFEEKEKRQIDVMIYRQHNFLVMNIINPISEQLVYEDGLPLTRKADKFSHGFGLRSIRQILRKYDGFLNISEEDGCFSLKMLIPIQLIK